MSAQPNKCLPRARTLRAIPYRVNHYGSFKYRLNTQCQKRATHHKATNTWRFYSHYLRVLSHYSTPKKEQLIIIYSAFIPSVLDVPSVLFKLETYQNIIIVTLVNKKQTYRSLTSVPLDQYDMNSEIYQNFLSIDYEMIENKCHRCIDFGRFKKK
eukprot:809995_1